MARGVGEIAGTPALACVAATALALLVTAAVFYLLARRLRDQARLEQTSLTTPPPLTNGPVALAGTVETSDGAAAIEVTLEEEREDGDWREVSRTTAARPFVLRLEGGAAVRVVPGDAPLLLDALGPAETLAPAHQRRRASLDNGERVFVRGLLRRSGEPGGASPYRAGDPPFELAAPRRGPMVLSTEALSGALERRAGDHLGRSHLLLASLAVVVLLSLHVLFAALWWIVVDAPPPTLQFDLYFWVMLIAGTAIAGAVISAATERPWYARRGPR
ncbi:hypothetical protein [Nannocystis bainbridge]|uniref:RING-type E3 ubiquitin transferase n=1 Tax=Nannocystis bainbridge TaxID=2995303 RepID=A0ABT5DWS6_9BACT|nr:hypothetical protein [Nannocystis bainbridge]MDC0718092.1 hypothetical protein [Nannocystis bainbridge]